MSELDKIKALVPNFYFDVVNGINVIDSTIRVIIGVDLTRDAKNPEKRVEFELYFDQVGFQNKIRLLKIILKENYPDILKKYPNYFAELGNVKGYRDSIGHSPVYYERDSNEQNAKLVIPNIIYKKQKKLSKRQMDGILKTVEKCINDTREILRLIGKAKNLNF
jgi:hypothetical protein